MPATTAPRNAINAAVQAAAELDAAIAGVEDWLSAWAVETGAALAALSGKVTGTALDKLIRPVVEELVQLPDGYAAGAGFMANAGLLGPERSYIAWWQGANLEPVDALASFSPNSISRYVKAGWFRIPVETGQAHVTGPYADFLCTDVLTFSHPVLTHPEGPAAGIVGMDVTVQRLEDCSSYPVCRRFRVGSGARRLWAEAGKPGIPSSRQDGGASRRKRRRTRPAAVNGGETPRQPANPEPGIRTPRPRFLAGTAMQAGNPGKRSDP